MASLSNVFKAYDIRGVVPDELNALQFRAIGVAVARFTGAPTILIARDMRESGVELSESFALGARMVVHAPTSDPWLGPSACRARAGARPIRRPAPRSSPTGRRVRRPGVLD